jgi:hypothetical protein
MGMRPRPGPVRFVEGRPLCRRSTLVWPAQPG